ncbi:MAG: DUF255 domain-containing protein [Aureispira sp.]|nr:DUF255 domain-containing protein [Aureispira sp.]
MKFLWTALLLSVTTTLLLAQNPVKWKASIKHVKGQEYDLIYSATIEDGWKTYSQFLESDEGPVATEINYDSKNVQLIGKAEESASKPEYRHEGHDPVFDMSLIYFKHDYTITQRVKVTNADEPIVGYLTFMTCDHERCLPPKDFDFSIAVPKAAEPVKTDNNQNNNNKTDNTDPVVDNNNTDNNQPDNTTDEQPDTPIDNPDQPTPNTPDNDKPVTWAFSFNQVSETEYDLTFTAALADGWYTYSQFLEDGDVIPITMTYDDSDAFELVGKAVESTGDPANRIEGHDKMFDMNLIKFKHDYTSTQRIKVSDAAKPIKGYLTFQTCDATKCLPPTDVDFSFALKAAATDNPGIEGLPTDGEVFHPERPQLIKTRKQASDEKSQSWLTIFILGFGGGLIALLTPCVFPMIPLTVSFFTKRSKSKAEGIRNATIYGASIIAIYTGLGLLVTILLGPDFLNWFSTWWVANLGFFVLFTVFAFSFFGYYEITLPSSWSNKSDQAADKGGLIGIFFMAFTLSLVSFSCTGPIIGTLLVQAAANGDVAGPFAGMLGFSIALALPFTLFAIFPGWLNSLPRSGGWMTSVKVVLGFLELAFAFKFLSTADLTEHWGILPYEAFIAIWALVFAATSLYLFGLIKFPHDNPNAKIGNARKGLAALTAVFAVYIASGFMTNPKTGAFHTPSLLSGLAPSACYSYIKECPRADVPVGSEIEGLSDHCPPGINQCFDDYYMALKYAKKINKPVLVDFTGYGCVNCRKMEENVWVDEEVNRIINEDYILVSLYVDDRKKLEKTLVDKNGQKLRTVGSLWATFQLVNFEKQSQPYYILISPNEDVLNSPRAYTPDIATYKGFLEEGLKKFKAMNTYIGMK